MIWVIRTLSASLAGVFLVMPADAQQATLTTSRMGVRDGFFENFGVGWGGRWQGPWGAAYYGWGGNTVPPFAPGFGTSGWRFGFGTPGGSGPWFGLHGESGSHRSLAMDSASVTIPNGGIGVIQDATIRPFVTGWVPVVGDYVSSPLAERVTRLRNGEVAPTASPSPSPQASAPSHANISPIHSSTAARGDISVDEIRRTQAASRSDSEPELDRLIAEAMAAEKSGRFGVARVRYRQAAEKAEGQRKLDLLRRLEHLRDQ